MGQGHKDFCINLKLYEPGPAFQGSGHSRLHHSIRIKVKRFRLRINGQHRVNWRMLLRNPHPPLLAGASQHSHAAHPLHGRRQKQSGKDACIEMERLAHKRGPHLHSISRGDCLALQHGLCKCYQSTGVARTNILQDIRLRVMRSLIRLHEMEQLVDKHTAAGGCTHLNVFWAPVAFAPIFLEHGHQLLHRIHCICSPQSLE